MSTKRHKANHPLLCQALPEFFDRLRLIMKQQTIPSLIEATGISKTTLYMYANGEAYPCLPRLALIADECNVTLQWLLLGDSNKHEQTIEKNEQRELTIIDDVMSPTLPEHSSVRYQLTQPMARKQIINDGIYVLATEQGMVVRRVQWQENLRAYLIFGDNPHYPPSNNETPCGYRKSLCDY